MKQAVYDMGLIECMYSSSWIECPNDLTGGKNMNVYVKPGSHPWDTRFQVHTFCKEALLLVGIFISECFYW